MAANRRIDPQGRCGNLGHPLVHRIAHAVQFLKLKRLRLYCFRQLRYGYQGMGVVTGKLGVEVARGRHKPLCMGKIGQVSMIFCGVQREIC